MSASISLDVLNARAMLYQNLREFFSSQRVFEVETSLFRLNESTYNSPIFQMSKQYREEPVDRRHHKEFSVLQWSQFDWAQDQVLLDLDALLKAIFSGEFEPEHRTFRQAFIQRLGFDPDTLSAADLRQEARRLGLSASLGEDRLAWLKLIFVHFIEPTLGIDIPLYLTDLPRLWRDTQYDGDTTLDCRVDIYIDGIKVGSVLIDTLIDTLNVPEQPQQSLVYQHVVFGLDRLLMIILETRQISKVINTLEEG